MACRPVLVFILYWVAHAVMIRFTAAVIFQPCHYLLNIALFRCPACAANHP
jgi:hypothetical protein